MAPPVTVLNFGKANPDADTVLMLMQNHIKMKAQKGIILCINLKASALNSL